MYMKHQEASPGLHTARKFVVIGDTYCIYVHTEFLIEFVNVGLGCHPHSIYYTRIKRIWLAPPPYYTIH